MNRFANLKEKFIFQFINLNKLIITHTINKFNTLSTIVNIYNNAIKNNSNNMIEKKNLILRSNNENIKYKKTLNTKLLNQIRTYLRLID